MALNRAKMLWERFYNSALRIYNTAPVIQRDIVITIAALYAATYSSNILLGHTGAENNSALVFVLAVALISFLTTGYFYGVVASVVGAFMVNFFFMVPYAAFSLSRAGYPVAMLSMLTISILICTLTTRVKRQKEEAIRREQNTKHLYALNEKLNQEKNQIQLQSERERIRGNILRAVSHDLRTPLTTISGSASVLMSIPEVPEQNAAMLRDIKNEADSLIIMVENLLSVTRIQDGNLPLTKRNEMLEEVVSEAIITTRRRFPNQQVELELSDDLLYLPMEPVLIKQVVVNLLENAVRHASSCGPIILRLLQQESFAVVEVMDQGKGLPLPVLQAVQAGRPVSRDITGDSTRGMGIGLSVCASIIKVHNGFFQAQNRTEGGAVFRFGLPIEQDVQEDEST